MAFYFIIGTAVGFALGIIVADIRNIRELREHKKNLEEIIRLDNELRRRQSSGRRSNAKI